MSDYLILYVNASSGETIVREPNQAEKKQIAADKKSQSERAENESKQTKNRAAAVAHAKTLGFTDEMIAVMYPGLVNEQA